MDAVGFNRVLANFAKTTVPEKARLIQRKIALDALRLLVQRTPVKTGRARMNWQVGIDNRPTGVLEVGAMHGGKGTAGLPPLSTVGQETVDKGSAVLNGIQPFCTVYITNNVNYILKLENGGSRQAPAGMLAVTFDDLVRMFR